MTSDGKGVESPQMDEIATEQVNARLAWFLAGAYAGGAKRKRIARDFKVSPDTAKGWLNGSGPGRRHFDAMVNKWGESFLRFVYPASEARRAAELYDIAERLKRLEAVRAEMVLGENDGFPQAPGGEAVGQGREGVSALGLVPRSRDADRDGEATPDAGEALARALQRREVRR